MKDSVTLRAGQAELADFVSSLLSQPRRIEGRSDIPFIIGQAWVANLYSIISQRMDQHPNSLASLQQKVFYSDGWVDILTTEIDVNSYLSRRQCEIVGLDVSMSYLVQFGTKIEPEKQDIRVEVFKDVAQKYLVNVPPEDRIGGNILYSINFSNISWGEDIASHIKKHIASAVARNVVYRVAKSLGNNFSRTSFFLLFSIALLMTMYFILAPFDKEASVLRARMPVLLGKTDIVSISEKLDLILENNILKPNINIIFILPAVTGVIVGGVPFLLNLLIRRFSESFLTLNDFTKNRCDTYRDTNTRIKWGLLISIFIGIPASLVVGLVKGAFFR